MSDVKYVVYDKCSELSSDIYSTYEEAMYELEHECTHKWSSEAVIMEVNE